MDGNLALSRAFGDFQYKDSQNKPPEDQAVTCMPDILSHKRNLSEDEFIIVACDGIWDCKDNQGCVDFLSLKIKENTADTNMCKPLEFLLDDCCAETTDNGIGTDNMTAVLI